MAIRLKWFKCPECGEFEEVCDLQDKEVECPKCKKMSPLLDDLVKQIHHPGYKYRDVSWSTWNV